MVYGIGRKFQENNLTNNKFHINMKNLENLQRYFP